MRHLSLSCVPALVLATLAQCAAVAATAPSTRPALQTGVDERVELMCIIFRLSGSPEYGKGLVPGYAADVDKHFAAFKDHAVVQTAKRLRQAQGISFDAPMTLAAHIDNAADLKLLVKLDPWPATLDKRWTAASVEQFLADARDFAQKADTKAFFAAHRALYDLTNQRLSEALARDADLAWFGKFYGSEAAIDFHLAPALLNGGNCYGVSVEIAGRTHMHSILGVWETDGEGKPRFPKMALATVVHESAHSFANPLVDKHAAKLEPAATKLFTRVDAVMRRQAYGNWKTMMYESLVRATVVRYRAEHEGPRAGLAQIAEEQARGFLWVGELAALLAEYEGQRAKYPTLDSFMPRIAEFYADYTSEMGSN